jgi:hypothetical protein
MADIDQRELEENKIVGRECEGLSIVILTAHGSYFLGFSIGADIYKLK